jgi:GNAT superfamily N-acetyltransferase
MRLSTIVLEERPMKTDPPSPAVQRIHVEWLCFGPIVWRGDSPLSRALIKLTFLALRLANRFTDRIRIQRFVRFELHPADLEPAPSDIRLTSVNAEIIARLRTHPDAANDDFASGLAFWDLGVRNGFVWFEGDDPVCFQWQLTEADLCVLRERSPWGNMYPHLSSAMAQREKLWVFSSARRKGIASRFAVAMLAEARRLGVTTLLTHVSEGNGPALALVTKAGWARCGSIVRYNFDLAVLRQLKFSVAVHLRTANAARQPVEDPAPQLSRSFGKPRRPPAEKSSPLTAHS